MKERTWRLRHRRNFGNWRRTDRTSSNYRTVTLFPPVLTKQVAHYPLKTDATLRFGFPELPPASYYKGDLGLVLASAPVRSILSWLCACSLNWFCRQEYGRRCERGVTNK